MTWDDIYLCENVNKAYDMFASKVNLCFNASFPIVKLSRKCVHVTKWITSRIEICSKRKNKLYKNWKLTGKVSGSTTYNIYRKTYKKVLAEAEQSYYREKFNLKCNTTKQLWSNLNHFFHF